MRRIALVVLIFIGAIVTGSVLMQQFLPPEAFERGPKETTVLPTETPLPPTANTPNPDGPTSDCKLNELSSKIELEAASGSTYGILSLENITNDICTIHLNRNLNVNFDKTSASNLTVKLTETAVPGEIELKPGQTIYAGIRYSNGAQCSNTTSYTKVSFTQDVNPGSVITFNDIQGRQVFDVTTCQSLLEATEITVYPWKNNTPSF